MRENDFNVRDVGSPGGIPFGTDEAVIVYGTQRINDLRKRKNTFSDKFAVAVFVGILEMNMLDVCAEIFQAVLGSFACKAGVIRIPEGAKSEKSPAVSTRSTTFALSAISMSSFMTEMHFSPISALILT